MKFAVVVVLALVAVSQVHSASTGLAELGADRSLAGNLISCGIEYMRKITEVPKDLSGLISETKETLSKLSAAAAPCFTSSHKVKCVSQIVRNSWEENSDLRGKILVEIMKMLELVEDVQKCLTA